LVLANEDFALPGGVRCKVEFLPTEDAVASLAPE
jgi:hypothetical protein